MLSFACIYSSLPPDCYIPDFAQKHLQKPFFTFSMVILLHFRAGLYHTVVYNHCGVFFFFFFITVSPSSDRDGVYC